MGGLSWSFHICPREWRTSLPKFRSEVEPPRHLGLWWIRSNSSSNNLLGGGAGEAPRHRAPPASRRLVVTVSDLRGGRPRDSASRAAGLFTQPPGGAGVRARPARPGGAGPTDRGTGGRPGAALRGRLPVGLTDRVGDAGPAWAPAPWPRAPDERVDAAVLGGARTA